MPPFTERQSLFLATPVAEEVVELLGKATFEQILDVPAVPADGRGRVRYAFRLALEGEPEPWYLRAHGTEFDLLLRSWIRSGLNRCFSLGWGLNRGRQTRGLLLAQAVEPRAEDLVPLAELLSDALRPYAEDFAAAVGHFHGTPCLRVSAVIGDCLG